MCFLLLVASPLFRVGWCGCSSFWVVCRGVCDALSGVLPGAHRCFGCGFLVPHRSAKSGCFGEYLNVFAGFLCCFVWFYEGFWNLSRIEF